MSTIPPQKPRRRHAAARARLATGMASVLGALGLTGYLAVTHIPTSTSSAAKSTTAATSSSSDGSGGDDSSSATTSTTSSLSTSAVAATPATNPVTSSHGS